MCEESSHEIPVAETVSIPQERRTVLKAIVGAVLVGCTFSASRAHAKKVGLALGKVSELQNVGGSKLLKIKDQDVLLVRDGADSVRAINPICTHKHCLVRYVQESNDLHCKCHKSAFKLDGTVMGGPAKKNLTTFPTQVANGQLVITLPD